MLIKRAVLLLIIKPYLVKTENMLADIFTKATDKGTFGKMRNAMMNIHGNLYHGLEKARLALRGNGARIAERMMELLS